MSNHRICDLLKILTTHEAMMGRRVMLGEVVGRVGFPGSPVEEELALAYAALEPMIPHTKGFGAFKTDFCMENTIGSGIVGFEWSPSVGLRMTHFRQGSPNGDGILSIQEEGADFSFGSGGSNGAQSFA
jgi:hypothetical protein